MMQELVKITQQLLINRQKDYFDLLPQFAANAEKHEGAPRVNVSNKTH